MSLTDPYATAEEYRATIKPDADDGGDALITEDLTAISRYLDGKLGQFFGQDETESERVFEYWPKRHASVYRWPVIDRLSTNPILPPFTSLTSITFADGLVIPVAELDLYPFDAGLRPEPVPYRAIGRANHTGFYYNSANNKVRMMMKAGWPAIPAAIKATTIQLCAMLRLETPRATRRIPEMGDAIETSPSAQALVWRLADQYKLDWLY